MDDHFRPTFGYLHIRDLLPLVHRYEPLFPPTTTAIHRAHEHVTRVIGTQRAANLTSTTSLSLPTALETASSLSRENFAPGKRYEVTMT